MEVVVCAGVAAARVVLSSVQQGQIHTFVNLGIAHLQFLTLVLLISPVQSEWVETMTLVAFPTMHLTLKGTDWIGGLMDAPEWLSGMVCEGCGRLFLWTLLLSLLALLITFSSRDRRVSFQRLSVFNTLCLPDAVLAVSSVFCRWQSGLSYWHASFSFATAIQWTVFSLIAPAICFTNPVHWGNFTSTVYKEPFKIWTYALRGEMVSIVFFQHFSEVWFKPTPGLTIVLLCLMLYTCMKVQEIYWPYISREANIVSEDCYFSVLLITLWKWFQVDWLFYLGLLFPLRQVVLLKRFVYTGKK